MKKKEQIQIYSEDLTIGQIKNLKPYFIISYNYKFMISMDVIKYMKGNIINLHCSFLPWNRGANPNFWSFYKSTPKGVTIHQVSEKLDQGLILYQKECFFQMENETFVSTYNKLQEEIENLLKKNWEEIKKGNYCIHQQQGRGSYQSIKDMKKIREKVEFQWMDNIAEVLKKCHEAGL